MSRFDVRERDLTRLLDVVAALREPSGEVTPNPDACWGAPVEVLSADPTGPGVRWRSLELLRELLGLEGMCLHGLDTAQPSVFFVQEVVEEGPDDYFRAEPGQSPADLVGVDEWLLDRDARFWAAYWDSDCSLPDRTGAWDVVYGTDLGLRLTAEEWSRRMGEPLASDIFLATPLDASRQLRLLGWRDGWSTFSERERGFLELLEPHVVEAWRRSCATDVRLTPGQRRVLELVRDGHTNRRVGRELGIAEATVRTHLQNAYEALGVNNRVAAVAVAFGSPTAAGTPRSPVARTFEQPAPGSVPRQRRPAGEGGSFTG